MALGMRLFLGAAADEGGAAAGDSSIVAVIVVQFQFLCTRVNLWAKKIFRESGVQRDHTRVWNKSRYDDRSQVQLEAVNDDETMILALATTIRYRYRCSCYWKSMSA